jgi:predicted DNA-binding ArsR family transcriptional regulator
MRFYVSAYSNAQLASTVRMSAEAVKQLLCAQLEHDKSLLLHHQQTLNVDPVAARHISKRQEKPSVSTPRDVGRVNGQQRSFLQAAIASALT